MSPALIVLRAFSAAFNMGIAIARSFSASSFIS